MSAGGDTSPKQPPAKAPASFAGKMGLRKKLLLLTLIPLVPLAAANVGSLFYLHHVHTEDLERRLDRVEELWQRRLLQLTTLSERTAEALSGSKQVEQALRRNHWARAREVLVGAAQADPDLRVLLVDADGRLLADSRSPRFDEPLTDRDLVARALAGEAGTGVERLDRWPFVGAAHPVRVVGGVEGAVWVGYHLDAALLERFALQSQAAVTLVGTWEGDAVSTIPGPPHIPPSPTPFDVQTDDGARSYRMRPADVILAKGALPIRGYVGLDHTDLGAAVRRQLIVLGSTFVALLVVILVVTLLLSHRVVRGIQLVVERMRALQKEAYEKIEPVSGRDEIAFLGRGYNQMVEGLAERDFVRQTFGRYMSPDVARAVLDAPEGLALGGEEREVTILLCDLRGFTAFSAVHGPEEVVRVLNIFLGRMSEVIQAHDGTIIEFLGDAILALFGAPLRRDDDALRAVVCSVAMQRAMCDVNARLHDEGIAPLHMGIGLCTGQVVAGNIGSETRAKYGVVGQPVNLAARVESFTVGEDVLIADAVLRAAGDTVQTGPARTVQVKGSDEPLTIHPVLGVGPPFSLRVPSADVPEEERVPCADGTRARIWPLEGKEVAAQSIIGQALALGPRSLVVEIEEALPTWSDVRLQLGSVPPTTDSLYGKIVEIGAGRDGVCVRTVIRLTRVSPDDREVLDALLAAATDV